MRKFLFPTSIFLGAVFLLFAFRADGSSSPEMIVYKSPTCGCCSKWVTHAEKEGFTVKAHDVEDVVEIKKEHGVPIQLRSCHTTLVDGYVIEGHVPADVVKKLLEEKPDIAGLAVPGMPIGSPGMEGPNPVAYDIVAFTPDGETSVYASR